jgi:hypothetical protein
MAFVPDSVIPPLDQDTPRLPLCVLSECNAVQDYEWVMACADDIRGVFGLDNGWPGKYMTLTDIDEIVQWIETSWPFKAVAFPGRNIGWNDWCTLAGDEKR